MYMTSKKLNTFKFLTTIFPFISKDVIYVISKFSGKYIHLPKIENNTYKTKSKSDKYYTKHLVVKTRFRGWSI